MWSLQFLLSLRLYEMILWSYIVIIVLFYIITPYKLNIMANPDGVGGSTNHTVGPSWLKISLNLVFGAAEAPLQPGSLSLSVVYSLLATTLVPPLPFELLMTVFKLTSFVSWICHLVNYWLWLSFESGHVSQIECMHNL